MTTVYVAMIDDRHVDPEAYVFTTEALAVGFARNEAFELARANTDVDESPVSPVSGWLYHATYSVEGDSVWVVARELDKR